MIDFSTLKELYVDGKKVTSLFLDGHEVPVGGIDPALYETTLVFRTLEASNMPFEIALSARGTPPDVGLEWSTDGKTWTEMSKDYTNPASIPNQTAGTEVFVRASKINAGFGVAGQPWDWRFWTANATYELAGNMKYLLDPAGGTEDLSSGGFPELFSYNPGLAGFDDLSIGISAVEQDACWGTFRECSHLVDARGLNLGSIKSISGNGFMQTFYGCRNMEYAPAIPNVSYTTNSLQNTFYGCSKLSHVDNYLTGSSWTNACRAWLTNVSSNGVMICNSSLGRDDTISRGSSACPNNWLVGNYDVDGSVLSNAFTRGNYVTAFLENGSPQTPNLASLSVFNGQTTEKLEKDTDYIITYPSDITTAGTKAISVDGNASYTGTKTITYRIIAKNLNNCTKSIGTTYDNEGPCYTVIVQPDTGYTLVEGTDYTVSTTTAGGQSTVTVTGIGSWTGTYSTTVAHKTNGSSPITVYKNDSSDTKPLKVALRNQGTTQNATLQCRVDDNAWTAMTVNSQLTASSKVEIRALDTNTRLATSDSSYLWIDTGYNDSTAAQAAVSGNIMSLIDRSETQNAISVDYTFANTFANNDNLIDASHLSCSQVSSGSSRALRAICAGRGMSYGILDGNPSQLTGAPDLFTNVTAYGNARYQMGDTCRNCSALTSVTITIPGFTGAANAYPIGACSFGNCVNIISGILKSHAGDGYVPSDFKCMEETFLNCSSLTCISTDITAWPTNGFNNWTNGVAATGTFICPTALGTDATIQRGASYCPTGWTVVNYDA